jgi:hypothetical protein
MITRSTAPWPSVPELESSTTHSVAWPCFWIPDTRPGDGLSEHGRHPFRLREKHGRCSRFGRLPIHQQTYHCCCCRLHCWPLSWATPRSRPLSSLRALVLTTPARGCLPLPSLHLQGTSSSAAGGSSGSGPAMMRYASWPAYWQTLSHMLQALSEYLA